MSWPPRAEQVEERPWTPGELRFGDLIFCAKDGGLLTNLGRVSGEPWRHVGSITHDDAGELVVVENIGPRFVHRALDDFLQSYQSFGAARLDLPQDCVLAANDWMSARVEREGNNVIYAWDDLILAGLIAVTKRGVFVGAKDRVRAAIEAAGAACKKHLEREGKASLTCSAFIQLAYDDSGGGCRIKHKRWRSATTDWPPRVASIGDFLQDNANIAGFEDMSIADKRTRASSPIWSPEMWKSRRM